MKKALLIFLLLLFFQGYSSHNKVPNKKIFENVTEVEIIHAYPLEGLYEYNEETQTEEPIESIAYKEYRSNIAKLLFWKDYILSLDYEEIDELPEEVATNLPGYTFKIYEGRQLLMNINDNNDVIFASIYIDGETYFSKAYIDKTEYEKVLEKIASVEDITIFE